MRHCRRQRPLRRGADGSSALAADHRALQDFEQTLRFWSDRGVDGFRVDVAHALAKDLTYPLRSHAELVAMQIGAEGSHPLWDREELDEIYGLNGGGEGPFRRMDRVGLDVVLDIEEHYAQVDPHLPEGPRRLLREYVARGELGVKTGRGFYAYARTDG